MDHSLGLEVPPISLSSNNPPKTGSLSSRMNYVRSSQGPSQNQKATHNNRTNDYGVSEAYQIPKRESNDHEPHSSKDLSKYNQSKPVEANNNKKPQFNRCGSEYLDRK